MTNVNYYCPLCGNSPYRGFANCMILSQKICSDCDDAIRQFFTEGASGDECTPVIIERLVDQAGVPLVKCKSQWCRSEIARLLMEVRDSITFWESNAELTDPAVLKDFLRIFEEIKSLSSGYFSKL